jgi:hypothetical protein
MGTLTTTNLTASLRITLLDPTAVTWSNADFLVFANEAQRAACGLRPDLYTKREAIDLVAGTLQSLPAGGTVLLRLEHNIASGRPCRLVDVSMLDNAARFWRAATPETDVQEWAIDTRDRKRFLTLPPNDGDGSVMALYCAVPPAMADGGTITIDDVHEFALLEFMAYKAYSANTQRQDLAKASAAYERFKAHLGINAQSLAAITPKPGAQGAG